MKYNVNEDLVNGNDVFLYLFTPSSAITSKTAFTSANTEVLAFATSCSLQVDGETIDTSNKMSCQWNSNIAGKNSYTVSADALYTATSGACNFDRLLALMIQGEAIGWAMAKPVDDNDVVCENNEFFIDNNTVIAWGYALITSLSLEAGNNEVASCSTTLTGSGEILTD